ncbi:Trypsin-like peptidase domain-containing protein [Alkalispirochaeta americana]|uniref:Trypsin-like peptidase domain-containing protein n=1 Tax=Alkalispirochaeta americana TaxID=159291 RepID=A0A1N6YKS7_9SPIO|nr:serine protease [Alkalispirochaeta americana]SIR15218.1 Trypsin-like peptidase domain-containing protein [Alkalispirochaeta americana]
MAQHKHPIEQLIHSTARIECLTPDGVSSGSGFFYAFLRTEEKHVPCIVTNKHVVDGATEGKIHLTTADDKGNPELGNHIEIRLGDFSKMWVGHPDKNIDLAAIPIAPLLHEAEERKVRFFYVMLDETLIADQKLLSSLPAMEEIIMIGYPNGIWDAEHNLPVIRKGITATHPRLPLNGKPEFLIDAACFPGSSGSPVFLANIGSFVNPEGALCAGNRIALLGILYAGPQHTAEGEIEVVEIPTASKPISRFRIPNNLGLVIEASQLQAFDSVFQEKMQ